MRRRWLLGLPAARVVLGLIGFLTSVLTVRALGPAEFGYFSAGMAVATVVGVLGPWGLDQLQIFHGLDEHSAGWASRRVAAITVAAGLAMALVWPSLSTPSRLCAFAGSAGLAGRVLLGPWLTAALKRLEIGVRIRREFGTLALSGVIGLLAAEVTRSAVASLSATAAFLLLVASAVGRRNKGTTDARTGLRPILRQGMPYALSSAAYTLYFSVDSAILASFRDAREVGQYRAAYVLFAAALVVPIALNNDLLRANLAKSGSQAERVRVIRRFGLLTLAVGCTVFLGLALMRGTAIRVAYGDGYSDATPLLGILSLAIVPAYVNSWLSNAVVGVGKIRMVSAVQGVLTVLNIAANLIVIPRHGAQGAAYSTVATEGLATAIYGVLFLRTVAGALGRYARKRRTVS